jgi:hypothetical protein
MRKAFHYFPPLLLAVLLSSVFAASSFAEGTASTPTITSVGNTMKVVAITYKGDSSTGSVPAVTLSSTAMAEVKGYFLYSVRAYPVSDGTAPDPAKVAVKNPRKDLLGDQGDGLVPASGENEMVPYNAFKGRDFYPVIVDPLTIEVTGQDTPEADFIVEIIAVR